MSNPADSGDLGRRECRGPTCCVKLSRKAMRRIHPLCKTSLLPGLLPHCLHRIMSHLPRAPRVFPARKHPRNFPWVSWIFLHVLQVLRALSIGGHWNWFCRKAMFPFESHSGPPVQRITAGSGSRGILFSGPLGSLNSHHRRTLELVLQKSPASFRIT